MSKASDQLDRLEELVGKHNALIQARGRLTAAGLGWKDGLVEQVSTQIDLAWEEWSLLREGLLNKLEGADNAMAKEA